MLKCKEATELTSHQLDRKLGLIQRINLRIHLFMCNRCSRFAQQISLFSKIGHRSEEYIESDVSHKLSDDARSKINQQLRSNNTSINK